MGEQDEKKIVHVSPFALTDKTKALNDKFYIIINEIARTYPTTRGKGTSDPSTVVYNDNMAKLETLQNDYFLYKNEIIQASEKVQAYITNTNDGIMALEGQNKVLKLHYDNLKSSSHSAEGLFDDAKITRNQLLVSNVILFGIMAGCGYGYYKSLKT